MIVNGCIVNEVWSACDIEFTFSNILECVCVNSLFVDMNNEMKYIVWSLLKVIEWIEVGVSIFDRRLQIPLYTTNMNKYVII